MGKAKTDYRMAALVREVERRRQLPGLHNYSYGRLIADTTPEERDALEEKYRQKRRNKESREVYRVPDNKEDVRKAQEKVKQAGQ